MRKNIFVWVGAQPWFFRLHIDLAPRGVALFTVISGM
jgi:hypothetical protein